MEVLWKDRRRPRSNRHHGRSAWRPDGGGVPAHAIAKRHSETVAAAVLKATEARQEQAFSSNPRTRSIQRERWRGAWRRGGERKHSERA